MKTPKKYPPQMIADCRDLYLKNKGRNHKKIETDMHVLGWTGFRRRMLYADTFDNRKQEGWIDRYGWAEMLPPVQRIGLPRYRVPDDTFPTWLRTTMPQWKWNWKHQIYLYERLQRVTDEISKRLMIFMPPRHGKSELVTVRYAAWRLEIDPTLNIIIGSYNQKLANRFSRKIRRIAESRISISKNRRAADEWETTEGGGVRAVGAGAGIAGFGGGLVIIDDPIKNRAESRSETIRENIWEWFNDDIYTRLEPGAAVVLIQTRWHDDDLAGRLLKEMEDGGEHWEVVCLPALAEGSFTAETQRRGGGEESEEGGSTLSKESEAFNGTQDPANSSPRIRVSAVREPADPLGREEGEALCPERYDRAALMQIKRKLGSHSFAAMYQQRPVPLEGGLFKRDWFAKIIDKTPDGLKWCRGYDLAVSTKTSSDYTASFRCAMDKEGNLYIADGFRKRIEFPEQRRFAIERMTAERGTQHGIELALHGQALIQQLRRDPRLCGVAFSGVRVDGDKYTRASAWSSLAEEGKVFLVRGPWIDDFLDEVCRFTGKGDKHDDQVDAVSIAMQMLGKKGGKGFHTF